MLSAPGPPGPPVVRGRGSHLGVSGREGGGGGGEVSDLLL